MKTKILIFGPSPNLSTGYGKLGKYLYQALNNEPNFEVWYLGLQMIGYQENPHFLPIANSTGSNILPTYLKKIQPDIFISILDHWMPEWEYLQPLLSENKIKHLAHVTVNTVPCPFIIFNAIRNADHIVTPTDFVKEQLNRCGLSNVTTIYHGVNCSIFYPKKGLKDKEFVFIGLGCNKQHQKNWLTLLKAMQYLVYDLGVKTAKLKIVTEIDHPEGIDFSQAILQAGLSDYVTIFPTVRDTGFNEEQMAELYNHADCYVSASFGESFNYPQLESYACGLPSIVPDSTAMKELTERSGAGMTVPIVCYIPTESITEKAMVDYISLAEKMKEMTEMDRTLFKENALKFAKEHDWEIIGKKWISLIKEISKQKVDYIRGYLGI